MSNDERHPGENVPVGFAEALAMALARENLRTPPCPDCGRLMFATAELQDISVGTVVLKHDGTVGIDGHAREVPRWFCGTCKLSHPVADEDRPRWKAARRVQREVPDA
jgi:hypothetical protein